MWNAYNSKWEMRRKRDSFWTISNTIFVKRVLEEIKEYLKCGIVKTDNKLTKTMKYQISSIIDIKEILIPYLEEYPLLTSKYLNYQTFKEVIEIMYKKEHLTKEGERFALSSLLETWWVE